MSGNRSSTSEELEREIQGLVDQGEAQGLIDQAEADMIESVLRLDETTAGQIMVPRIDLAMIPSQADVDEAIRVIVDSGHSRIPVFAEDPDHIVGVLYSKDLLSHWGEDPTTVNLRKTARRPFFVPQSMPVSELMTAFKRRRVHIAIVVDEYGGTAGVVTMEDVLEEIVGEIEDEHDPANERVSEQSDGSLLIDARLEVDVLSEMLDIELPDELPEGRFETVGGFITTLLGRVPRAQEEVSWGPVRMIIVDADERRITQVQVFQSEPVAEPAAS